MRQDAWRGYLELALGVTEASRKQATKAVKRALGKGGATADQLQGLADELLKTSAANREAIAGLVRAELDRALSRVGLAKADEVAELNARVRELEAELRAARATAPAAPAAPALLGATAAEPVPATEPFGAAEPAAPVKAAPAKVAPVKTAPSKAVKKVAKKAVRTPSAPASPAEPGDALTATLDAAATGPTKTAPAKKASPAKKTAPAPVNAAPAKVAKKAPAKKSGGARS